MAIVPTNISYSSNILRQNLISLLQTYPFLNTQIVGISILGFPIYVIKLGTGPKKVFYSASIHANEWITSTLLMKFVEDYANSYVLNSKLWNYSIRDLYKSTSIYIMPMINPDGVDLVTNNLTVNSFPYQNAKLIANNYPSIPFPSGWKSNIRGVDFKIYQPFQSLILFR